MEFRTTDTFRPRDGERAEGREHHGVRPQSESGAPRPAVPQARQAEKWIVKESAMLSDIREIILL